MFNGKNIKNNETLKFYSGNNVIELSFDDSMNETSSSQFLSSNKFVCRILYKLKSLNLNISL